MRAFKSKNVCTKRQMAAFIFLLAGALLGIDLTVRPVWADENMPLVRVGTEAMERRIIQKVAVEYPPEARENHIEGVVKMEVVVDAGGIPSKFKILKGHPLLVPAAIKAVSKWRYKPFEVSGQPVAVVTTVELTFRLK
jgi:TonB family protein